MNRIFNSQKYKYLITYFGIFAVIISVIFILLSNMNIGSIIVLFASLAAALWYKIPNCKPVKIIKGLFLIGLLFMITMSAFIFLSGLSNHADMNEDAVIIPGCSVHGTKPSNTLSERIKTGAKYAKLNPKALIIASGGQGIQEDISEAEAIKNGLTALGIDSSRIILEDNSTSTSENFIYSKQLLDSIFGNSTAYSCVYVTNSFHAYRAGKLAAINGLQAHSYSARTLITTAPSNYAREVLAVLQLWIFKK